MINRLLFQTAEEKALPQELSLAALRIFAGLSMAFGHGLKKVPPNPDFAKGVGEMGFPLPELFAWSAGLAEFGGGLLLALGLLTRPAAASIALTMVVAAFLRHGADPYGKKELALFYLFAMAFFFFRGAGRLSLDYLISKGLTSKRTQLAAGATAALAMMAVSVPAQAETTSPVSAAAGDQGKSVLMVVTSASQIDAEHPTGLWLEEFAVPWLEFTRAGLKVQVASPAGAEKPVPVDPRSKPTPEQEKEWAEAVAALGKPRKLDASLRAENFDAIFVCGGHGAMIDLVNDATLQKLLGDFARQEKVIGAVCHGPAALVNAKGPDGRPLVAGKQVTAFSDEEERAVKLDALMPFLLETRLRELGAEFKQNEKFQPHTVRDGRLVTGQNPASSRGTARAVVEAVGPTQH